MQDYFTSGKCQKIQFLIFLFLIVIPSTVIKLQCSSLLCHMQNTFTRQSRGPFSCLDRNSRWLTMNSTKFSTSLWCNFSQWANSTFFAPKHYTIKIYILYRKLTNIAFILGMLCTCACDINMTTSFYIHNLGR